MSTKRVFLVAAIGRAGGFTPVLIADGCVATPSGDFDLRIKQGPGGSTALLLASPLLPVGVVPLNGVGDGNGQFTLNTTYFNVIGPGHLMLQAAVIDPAVPRGLTMTNAVDLHFH